MMSQKTTSLIFLGSQDRAGPRGRWSDSPNRTHYESQVEPIAVYCWRLNTLYACNWNCPENSNARSECQIRTPSRPRCLHLETMKPITFFKHTICEHNTCSLLTHTQAHIYKHAGLPMLLELPCWEHTLGDRNNRPLQSARTSETQWHHTSMMTL